MVMMAGEKIHSVCREQDATTKQRKETASGFAEGAESPFFFFPRSASNAAGQIGSPKSFSGSARWQGLVASGSDVK